VRLTPLPACPPGSVASAAFLAFLAIAVAAWPRAAAAQPLEGRVVGVADGDTLTLLDDSKAQHRIRLAGIDAPETGQPFGQRARENLARLAHGATVRADCVKQDRFGRRVCTVWVRPPGCAACPPTLDTGLAQLTQGLAWHFRRYAHEQTPEDRERYAFAEAQARTRRSGLWRDAAPKPPWEWREERRREQ
jgi:endonuclease YncB( thermonuclease family)